MFCQRAVILFLLLATAAPAMAQREPISDEPAPPRWVLVPRLGIGSYGDLWAGGEDQPKLGASNGAALGLALQFDPDGSLNYELAGSFSSVEYDFNAPQGSAGSFTGVGSLHLVRLAASLFYRVRQSVPGYFIMGAGALYYRPTERPPFGGTPPDDAVQWMPSAHVGLGYNLTSGAHTLQLDGRLYGTRPSQSSLRVGADSLDAAVSLDYRFTIGYRVAL